MATKMQRVQSIFDGYTNRATPLDLITRVADAIAKRDGLDPAALTSSQKLDLFLSTRSIFVDMVKEAEGEPPMTAAKVASNAAIEADFAEAV